MTSNDAMTLAQPDVDRRAEIEQRAYEMYLERGCEHGQDLDDWLKAESDLLEKDQGSPQPTSRVTTKGSAATSA